MKIIVIFTAMLISTVAYAAESACTQNTRDFLVELAAENGINIIPKTCKVFDSKDFDQVSIIDARDGRLWIVMVTYDPTMYQYYGQYNQKILCLAKRNGMLQNIGKVCR